MKITTNTKEISEDDEEVVELVRLTNINVVANGLVDRPANRVEFFALKREAGMEDKTKQAPTSDMSNEELHAAQEARSKEYGIEILESAALTFPKDYPTDLKQYGDPVNLAYPIDTEDRARNARVRFKQNYSAYSEAASRNVVHERIVRAELAMGIEPSFDPEDELDAALPSDIKDKLQKSDKAEDMTEEQKAAQKAEESAREQARDILWSVMGDINDGAVDSEEDKQLRESILSIIRAAVTDKVGDQKKQEEEQPSEPEQPQQPAEPASPDKLPTDQELESEQMASEKSTARERAKEIIWSLLDEIDSGAVDSDEDKQLRSEIVSNIREMVSEKMEREESACKPRQKGRPQFSKARVAKLKEAFASLKEMLDEIGELADAGAAAIEAAAGDGSTKREEPMDNNQKEIEELKAQLAAKEEELSKKSEELSQKSEDLSKKSEEFDVLKASFDEVSKKAEQASPPATFQIDGKPHDPSEKREQPKRINSLDMRIGRE